MTLKADEDGYGQMILDYHNNANWQPEIIERDDGLIGVSAGPQFYFSSYEEWPRAEQQAIKLARGRVLDLGCGAGRVLLYLQQQGHEAVGIDNSPLAVRVCRERGANDVRLRSITKVDASLGKFDTIVMFGNNFGLFANEKRARRLLRRFYNMTTAQARILATSRNIYNTDNPDHLAYHQRNRDRGRMGGQTRIRVRYKRIKSPWFDYLMVSPDEMRDLLEGSGWCVSDIIEQDQNLYVAIIEKC